MGTMSLRTDVESWPLAKAFRITNYTFNAIEVLVVRLDQAGYVGRGEASGVYYLNETPASMIQQIEALRDTIEAGITRGELQTLLPPGGARNALDCALWDLEAKSTGRSIWDLTGIRPKPVTTVFTLGIEDTPEEMAAGAIEASNYPILKIKVDADRPVERVAAIRKARPDARLVVDANQGWTFEQLAEVAPHLARMDVRLIEQPLPRGADEALDGYRAPLPLSADESCQHRGELESASRRYQIINIKLDKAGGLTEGLKLVEAIRAKGLQVLIGCRCATSLAMAPGFVVAQHCLYVELDGHLMLERDRPEGLLCSSGELAVPNPRLWG